MKSQEKAQTFIKENFPWLEKENLVMRWKNEVFGKRESFGKKLQFEVLRMRKEFRHTAISGLSGY